MLVQENDNWSRKWGWSPLGFRHPHTLTILLLWLYYTTKFLVIYPNYFLIFGRKENSVGFTIGRSMDGRLSGKGHLFQKFEPGTVVPRRKSSTPNLTLVLSLSFCLILYIKTLCSSLMPEHLLGRGTPCGPAWWCFWCRCTADQPPVHALTPHTESSSHLWQGEECSLCKALQLMA